MDSDEYRTPRSVFDELHAQFHFTFDAAATHENHLRPDYCTKDGYFAIVNNEGSPFALHVTKEDGLTRDWIGERVWCNPPYSKVGPWVKKASEHAKAGGLAVLLLNASTTSTQWFHQYIWDAKMRRPRERVELDLRPGRIAFLDDHGNPPLDERGKPQAPRYSNMVVIFNPYEVAS